MLRLEINVTRRHIYTVVAAIAVIVALLPLASYAADKFKDVPDSNIFHDDIAWLADAGVTKGCNPPANDEFCPGDNVRRETMAAFMRRLAVNQVVDAKTAITAEDADKLDGKDSTAFLGTTEKAADSDKLDGLDSAAFLLAADQPTATGDSYSSPEVTDPTLTGVGTVEQVSVSAPENGYLFVSASASFLADAPSTTVIWLQVNNTTCNNSGANFAAGGYAYAQGSLPISASFAQIFAAPKGDHTLTLCGNAYLGDTTQEILGAGVQSLWLAKGELTANLNAVTPSGTLPGTEG